MRILYTIADFGTKSGGTSTCVYDFAKYTNAEECLTEVVSLNVKNERDDCLIGESEQWIKALPNDAITPFQYSSNLKHYIDENISQYDLVHVHGLWLYIHHLSCSTAKEMGLPYVLTPHGMLYPDALHRSYWKKWPLLQLCFKRDIMQAACIHVTCKEELQHVRDFGYRGPIALIPNPMAFPSYLHEITHSTANDRTVIGFLGRLHPIKHVENMLYGVSLLTDSERDRLEVRILGEGESDYKSFLKNVVARLGLHNVTFCGFVRGREKFKQLAEMSLLMVPSDFENFGMIVTEALSVGTPVYASLGTPWSILNSEHCGWWRDNRPETLAAVIRETMNASADTLTEMGRRGKNLVKQKFDASVVAKMLVRLYSWLNEGGAMPEFVYLSKEK